MTFPNSRLNGLITPLAGLAGCVIVGAGLYEAVTHYRGPEIYSPLNHFISELGVSSKTSMADFFNKSLIASGILLTIFTVGLGRFLGNGRVARAGILTGIIATLNFSAVGYFTAADWLPHIIVASIFFCGAMVTILLFAIAIWRHRHLHPVHAFHATLIVLVYFVALLWPKEMLFQMEMNPASFVRPEIWMLTVLEWGYCLLICTWICMVSLDLLYRWAMETDLSFLPDRSRVYKGYSQKLQEARVWLEENLKL